jgi:hypothetical protein
MERFELSNIEPLGSVPLHMPGLVLQVTCSVPTFSITLKGGLDSRAIAETNQSPGCWQTNRVHFSLGRTVCDVCFDRLTQQSNQPLDRASVVHIQVTYCAIERTQAEWVPVIREWEMVIHRERWYKIPVVRYPVGGISVEVVPIDEENSPADNTQDEDVVTEIPSNLSDVPFTPQETLALDYHLAISGIPLTIGTDQSLAGVMTGAPLLDFSKLFGAWLVFDQDINWSTSKVLLTYHPIQQQR